MNLYFRIVSAKNFFVMLYIGYDDKMLKFGN